MFVKKQIMLDDACTACLLHPHQQLTGNLVTTVHSHCWIVWVRNLSKMDLFVLLKLHGICQVVITIWTVECNNTLLLHINLLFILHIMTIVSFLLLRVVVFMYKTLPLLSARCQLVNLLKALWFFEIRSVSAFTVLEDPKQYCILHV